MSSDTDRSNHKHEERADGYLMFAFLICILPSVHTVISTTAWLGNFIGDDAGPRSGEGGGGGQNHHLCGLADDIALISEDMDKADEFLLRVMPLGTEVVDGPQTIKASQ